MVGTSSKGIRYKEASAKKKCFKVAGDATYLAMCVSPKLIGVSAEGVVRPSARPSVRLPDPAGEHLLA